MGDNFVFEDNDEDSPIWTFEDRMAGDASQRTAEAATAEPRGVLDPQMADVLSAYSTEQGTYTALQMESGSLASAATGCSEGAGGEHSYLALLT